ncbi:MAG TPA: cell wall metabolism sensor histidine kinase WalK [Pseudogracilibacillus sp.]|nr:cell wall metabolism sensor histidine kinase WalK [Pseudogracilibacillus sp.]
MKKVGFFRSIQLKFILIYILLIILAVQVIGSYVARELEVELLNNHKESVHDRIGLLKYNVEQAFNRERTNDEDEPTLQEDVQNSLVDVDSSSLNIQVINDQGRVLGTNDYSNQNIVGKKISDGIVQRVIKIGSPLDNTVLNHETGERVFVRVEPIVSSSRDDQVLGVIYLESSLEGVYGQLSKMNEIFFKGSIIAMVVSILLGVLVARAITKPIVEMRKQAQTMARGDFSQKVKVYGQDEISQLAITFNHLNDRLKHSIAATEKEQRKLSSVVENMSEGVIATNSKGQITLVNEAAGRLFNRNPNSLINRNLIELLQLEEKVENIDELQQDGSIILDFSDEQSIFYVRANFTAIYDEHRDDISGFITVLSDVTEDEKIEQERRDFVSNVSHELRTPLTTLNSYTETLIEGAWKDEELAPKFLRVIQEETGRMIRMVNSLLQLSRVDSKELQLNRETVDFTTLFHDVIDRFEMNLKEEQQIVFDRKIADESYYVWADRDRLTQVLDNIISNAIKYSPNGGTITFKLKKRYRQIVISVKDEGIGIEYEQLDKIFDRFYRVDKARTRELGGTGLGLAITRELVEAHYGQIWANSKEGEGTTIYFTLPLMNEMRRQSG